MQLAQIRGAADSNGITGSGEECNLINDRFATTHYMGNNAGPQQQVQIRKYIPTKTLYPDKDVRNDPLFQGDTSSWDAGEQGPANNAWWYYSLQATTLNSPTSEDDVFNIRIELTYYTLFSGPVQVWDA